MFYDITLINYCVGSSLPSDTDIGKLSYCFKSSSEVHT